MTVKEANPIPKSEKFLNMIDEAPIFSTLKPSGEYLQSKIDRWDKKEAMFTSHQGLDKFLRMLLGAKNAPSTFQKAMDIILQQSCERFRSFV